VPSRHGVCDKYPWLSLSRFCFLFVFVVQRWLTDSPFPRPSPRLPPTPSHLLATPLFAGDSRFRQLFPCFSCRASKAQGHPFSNGRDLTSALPTRSVSIYVLATTTSRLRNGSRDSDIFKPTADNLIIRPQLIAPTP
jgi:hypothetical protein